MTRRRVEYFGVEIKINFEHGMVGRLSFFHKTKNNFKQTQNKQASKQLYKKVILQLFTKTHKLQSRQNTTLVALFKFTASRLLSPGMKSYVSESRR